ncbi:hypothetical protein [Pseudooceanicola sp.]|uniref:hypothetical protein n=1 Tax=Pseudooceanicola sp. TaxID=1914328 RepID=UPI0035192082
MATTIKQTESIPSSYPDVPEDLSSDAAALDSDAIWQRIESYVAHRWSSRGVIWIAEGPGEWVPPLAMTEIDLIEIWDAGWTTATPDASPLGGYELLDATYRFAGTVGFGVDLPAAVSEAFRRLAEYLAEADHAPGSNSHTLNLGSYSETIDRAPNWRARALQLSGAADLLRPYRKVS